MAKYLFLGASGFIGKAVIQELARDHQIRAFCRHSVAELEEMENVEFALGDFTKAESFDEILDGVDAVIHFISTTVPSDDTSGIPDEIEQNIIPTARLLESMVRCNVKRIIFASSAGTVYGETGKNLNSEDSPLKPICAHGLQKVVIENYIQFYGRRYGLDYSIIRIANPYGWGQKDSKPQGIIPIFINKNLNNEGISVFGDGTNMRDYIFIKDLAEGICRVIEYKGPEQIFNLGYGKAYSINEVVELIEKKMGKKFSEVNYLPKRLCDVKESYVDYARFHKLLDWRPQIDIDKGLHLTIERLSQKKNG